MSDLFNAQGKVGGIYKGTQVALTLGGAGIQGALVQNININYRRNVSRIWEVGTDDTYYIVGHTEGQMSMSRIVGKRDGDILDVLGDACAARDKVLQMSSTADACEEGESLALTVSGPMLVDRSFAVDAQQFMVTSQASIMFSGLTKN